MPEFREEETAQEVKRLRAGCEHHTIPEENCTWCLLANDPDRQQRIRKRMRRHFKMDKGDGKE